MSQATPVLVGIHHLEQRQSDPKLAQEPIQLMIEAVKGAAQDAGSAELLKANSVRVSKGIWPYQNPGKAIAEAIGCPNAESVISSFGGNFVQTLVNQSALDIQKGLHDVIIITGAECGYTAAKAAKARLDLDWSSLPGTPDRQLGEDKDMRHDAERAIRLGRPIAVYPIMEIALRNQLGLGVEEHLEKISQLWADFNQVAVNNPNAWIREAKTAEEIRTPSQINRPVSFPYPKFMNSNDNVDQAAALIMCSEEKAQALGISRDKWIYPWAGSDAHDHYYLSNRDNFYSSPAIRFAGNRCLELAGVNSHDLDMVDVYSCFPVAVQIASRELNLDTTKPLTVTGGLTWSGGPLNNYVMNSIVRMAELLRENQGQKGLITANGGYITKHAFGVYSTEPPSQPYQHADLQNEVDQTFKREVVIGHSGDGVVEGYSIVFGPDGMEKAFVAARLDDERRAWGVCQDQDVMQSMAAEEFCGRSVTLNDHVATF